MLITNGHKTVIIPYYMLQLKECTAKNGIDPFSNLRQGLENHVNVIAETHAVYNAEI